ncbi:hypothetical protein JYU14_01610 [Simkania negevensis]|uniref:Flagellar assembly protein FliH n=1 Tax=Simkania negevensis TaxID=83561 RepID=A0ABS3AQZ6_9BACT|nr:hypothetical protein [Simkania negevensis]
MKSSRKPSSSKQIIKGEEACGVIFCTPSGSLKKESKKEEEGLQALEEFWYKKGLKEGKKAGFEEGWKEGEEGGYRKGLDEGKGKGHQEGFSQAQEEYYQKGYEAAEEECQQAMSIVGTIADKMKEEQLKGFEQVKTELIDFALKIAKKIIQQQLKDREILKSHIDNLLAHAKPIIKDTETIISLAPDDYKRIENYLDVYEQRDGARIKVIADPGILPGNCFIESPLGLLNFTLDRELEDFNDNLHSLTQKNPL